MAEETVILSMYKKDFDKMVKVIESWENHKKKAREHHQSIKKNNINNNISWNLLTPIQQTIKSN